MERGLRDEVKTLIHSLLVPHSKGLPIHKLCQEYAECERKQIPFRALGHENVIDFLQSIPDTVRVTTLPVGLTIVRAVAKENVSHIQELVRGQKKSKNSTSRLMNNLLSGHRVSFSNRQQKPARPQYQYSQQYSYATPSTSHNSYNNWNGSNGQPKQLSQASNQALEKAVQNCNELPVVPTYQAFANVIKTHEQQSNQSQQYTPERTSRMNDKEFAQMDHQANVDAQRLSDEQVAEIKWEAVDMRLTSETLQTVSVAAEASQNRTYSHNSHPTVTQLKTERAPQTKVVPISQLAGCPRKPFGYGGSNDTFGVAKPDLANVCTPDTIFPHESFPDVPDYDFFFIIVAEVYNPDRFYWFLNHNRRAIEQLTDDMVVFYNLHEEYVCSLKEMYVGQIVAARYEDNLWYRARVIGYRNEEFQLFYIDYGSSGSVTIDKIRHLPLQFAKLPVQAFRGRLHGIKPVSPDGNWSTESSKLFLNLIKGSKVIAAAKMKEECLVVSCNEYETSYTLTLIDTNSTVDIVISDSLVDEGLAVSVPENVTDNSLSETSTQMKAVHDSMVHSSSGATAQADDISQAHLLEKNSAGTRKEQLNGSLVPGVQLAFELEKKLSVSSRRGNVVHEHQEEIHFQASASEFGGSNSLSSTLQVSPDSEAPTICRVKRIELTDGRVFHIIKADGELYLTKFELLKLIPDLDTKAKSSRMKLNVINKDLSENPQLFYECFTEQAPWIVESDGKLLQRLVLFPLGNVQTFLFLFGKDKTASAAFEAELKGKNNPSWDAPRKTVV